MQFFIHTFGCQMNENDSRLLAGLLQNAGYSPIETAADADIIIVNTCCVRQNAENRALGYIGSLKHLTASRRRIIVVCGCMAQKRESAELFQRSYRHVSILIGTFAASRLPRYIQEFQATGEPIVDVEERYDNQELLRADSQTAIENHYRAQVNINYGCNNFCSYCIVPYVRGRERSRLLPDILGEVRGLVANGVREVQLLGQNVNSYGKDLPAGQGDFADLLTELNQVDGLLRIRYMTSHPRDFDRRLAQRIASLDKVCRHFHLPLQAGSDKLLQAMNRGYSCDYYWKLLAMLRELFPTASFTSDLIVGFPGETEADFQQTLDFVAACRFDAAYTFLFSRRPSTPAALLPEQVEEDVKKERLQRLMAVQEPISLAKNRQLLGQILPVMAEGESKNDPAAFSGRTDGNKLVIFPAGLCQPGQVLPLRITEAQTWTLRGELVNSTAAES